jgi:hypothetical protein
MISNFNYSGPRSSRTPRAAWSVGLKLLVLPFLLIDGGHSREGRRDDDRHDRDYRRVFSFSCFGNQSRVCRISEDGILLWIAMVEIEGVVSTFDIFMFIVV